jgi:hypothetical protein
MFIIAQADIDKKTQAKDQMIQVFAFFVFASSHQDKIYIIQLITIAITAKTAVYCINKTTKFVETPVTISTF